MMKLNTWGQVVAGEDSYEIGWYIKIVRMEEGNGYLVLYTNVDPTVVCDPEDGREFYRSTSLAKAYDDYYPNLEDVKSIFEDIQVYWLE